MSITPLNLPLANYTQLCFKPATTIPPILLVPYLIVDTKSATEVVAREAFEGGHSFRDFRRAYGKYCSMAFIIASQLYSEIVPPPPGCVSAIHPDLEQVMDKTSAALAIPRATVLPASINAELLPAQREWMKNGVYWVFGCEDHSLLGNTWGTLEATSTAMVMLDRHVIEAGSIDPGNHRPLNVSARAETDFQSIVNDTYGRGAATWNLLLATIQIGMSVTFHAMHEGWGAEGKVAQFLASKRTHHLL